MIYQGEEFVAINCWRCNALFFLPRPLWIAAKHNEEISFHCPYGHSAHYPAGETTEDQLRRERDRLLQREAQLNDEVEAGRKRAVAAERKTARLLRRASAGVCPCCNRTFDNLHRHMASKHPEIVPMPKREAS